MTLHNWLYVSVSRIGRLAEPAELRSIVGTSIGRNSLLDVTGTLLFTGFRFAQCIEGPEAAVAEIRESIKRDNRHEAITTLAERPIGTQSFSSWSLAFAGPSPYVSRTLNRYARGRRVTQPQGRQSKVF